MSATWGHQPTLLDLPARGRSRRTDPATSRSAAAAVDPASHAGRILSLAWTDEGWTAEQVADRLADTYGHRSRPNNVATRLQEMAEQSLVQWRMVDGVPAKRPTSSKRLAYVWVLTAKGREAR